MKQPDNPHVGHRSRLKRRFHEEGLDHFEPVNILEMLLFFGLRQGDTNELAHRLLDRFHSLEGVLEAPYDQLLQVPGIGENCATLICFSHALMRQYHLHQARHTRELRDREEAAAYLEPCFLGLREEALYLLSLDGKGRVLGCDKVSEGSACSTSISPRQVVQLALQRSASTVFLAHNHPNGICLPSAADLSITQELEKLLIALDIVLMDHFIFVEGDYVSLKDSHFLHQGR